MAILSLPARVSSGQVRGEYRIRMFATYRVCHYMLSRTHTHSPTLHPILSTYSTDTDIHTDNDTHTDNDDTGAGTTAPLRKLLDLSM